jgi:nucleotide-binding universal stress UspA family protein
MTTETMSEKKILVCVDLGPYTELVSAYALWLAKVTGGEICLLHVIDYDLTPPTYVIPYFEVEKARLDADIKTWTGKLNNLGMPTEGKIAVGRLSETFHAAISSLQVYTIVLGYKSHPLRASSSERLIKSLEVPLLVVRGKKAAGVRLGAVEVKRILCATDFSEHSLKALEFAKTISKATDSEIDIVHVLKPLPSVLGVGDEIRRRYSEERREEAQRKMESLIGKDGIIHGFMREGVPSEVIASVAEETDASLLFIGARGLSYFKGVLLGSVTDALIKSSPCPVMVVH